MKKTFSLLFLGLMSSAFAQDLTFKDYPRSKMTDISRLGLKKEKLFKEMDRDLIKVGDSICSNRALVWAYDFKRFHNIDSAKIFLFYTKKSGEVGRTTWWYHVAPVINEKGNMIVMDAGFSGGIDTPITTKEWLKKFTSSENCKEIQAQDTDLIERMFSGYTYPQTTSHGTFDCYYKITPGGYWTPASVAMGLLGKDEDGQPVHYVRDEIDTEEVYAACREAVTGPMGRALGGGERRCKKYLGL